MKYILVDDEQARIIAGSASPVEIRDRCGTHLGYVQPGFTDEDIAIANQRLQSDEPRYTTAEVLQHLRALERS